MTSPSAPVCEAALDCRAPVTHIIVRPDTGPGGTGEMVANWICMGHRIALAAEVLAVAYERNAPVVLFEPAGSEQARIYAMRYRRDTPT